MKFKINPTLIGFIKKEFAQALKDPRMRMMIFVAPLIQVTLFGLALSSDVKNVRLAIAPTHIHDTALSHVYQKALASGWFIPALESGKEPFEQIQSGQADVVLIPPPEGLTGSVARGEGKLQILVNGSDVLRAQSVENYVKRILDQVVTEDFKLNPNPPGIHFEMRVLFNPTMRSAVFLVPGTICMLACLITIILTSMSISKEKETGTFEMLLSAPITIKEIMLGKTLPYVVMGMCNVPITLAAAVFLFGVPMNGNLIVLFLCAFVFVCTTVSVGTLVSTLTRNQQQSMMGSFLFLFPAIQLSGMMFPIENMPIIMKALAYMNPLTYFIELLRNIMLKGGDTRVIISHLAVLILVASVLITISYKKFKTTIA
jgi:ABC-2 type transport system permease protein